MLEKLSSELTIFTSNTQVNLHILLKIMAGIWIINIVNWFTGSKLNFLGIRPRKITGLIGIFTNTVLHKNFNHLFFNSIPLFALGAFMLSFDVKIFYIVSALIILMEGLAIWLIGRPGVHIGASALIMGYFAFIMVSTYKNPAFTTIFIALIVLYYFGSMLFSIFPTEEKTSWESHLLGFISGLAAYFMLF